MTSSRALFYITPIVPRTNMTGTLGGSNFTFPVFCMPLLALAGVRTTAERDP